MLRAGVVTLTVAEDRHWRHARVAAPQDEIGLASSDVHLRLERPVATAADGDIPTVTGCLGRRLDHHAQHLQPLHQAGAELLLHLRLGVEVGRCDLGGRPRRPALRIDLSTVTGEQDVLQLLLGLGPRYEVDLTPSGKWQQAPVAGEASRAGAAAVTNYGVGLQQDRAQRRRVGELGEVTGPARHEVV